MNEPTLDLNTTKGLNQRSRTLKTQAIILRSFDDGEADRTVIILTPEVGKLKARVRGARKINSRLGGHTDLLNLTNLNVGLGNHLNVVTAADSLNSFVNLKSNLERLAIAIYLAELMNALIPEGVPHRSIFWLLLNALEELNKNKDPLIISRYLELKALEETGYKQELYRCVLCNTNIQPNQHSYVPSFGGVVCSECTVNPSELCTLSLNSLKVLRHFDRNRLSDALSIHLDNHIEYEIEKILEQSIIWILEKQSKARKFVTHLQNLRKNTAGLIS
ncbi:MAG: DNA repair protein RecO [Dehalococcoidia bacterium]|nr:DNA repair protein RecO [Dehalococcoidia bacterium]